LDPHYVFAGLHLIDEQLQDNELDAAEETLEQLRSNAGGAFVRLRALRLACRREERAAAAEEFRGLCLDDGAPPVLVQRACEALVEAGWAETAEEVLASALAEEGPHPVVGKLWVERRIAHQDFGCVAQIEQLLGRGEVGESALHAYVDALGTPGKQALLADAVRR